MGGSAHWFLPINPAAHPQHMPHDWLTRPDASAVWEAIGRSQPRERWCLSTGFRTMRPGDVIWAYLSRRQEVCAVGTVRSTTFEAPPDPAPTALCPSVTEEAGGGADGARGVDHPGGWFVVVDWDEARTARLCRDPIPRSVFGQVPMSVCRVAQGPRTALAAAARERTR